MEIDLKLAKKVLKVVDAGLVAGLGEPTPGKMCVEAAVCYAMGLPHSDEPTCVSPALRQLKIRLNDSLWSSDAARTAGLRRLAVAQLGSAGTLNDSEFAKKVSVLVIQKYVPIALTAVARRAKGSHKAALTEAAALCSQDPSIENAKKAKAAADAADAAAADSAADSADSAAYAADSAADSADSADAAAYAAADAAAYAAYAAAYAAADSAAARNKILAEFGEDVVQILIELKAPGTAFLYLTE